MDSFDQISFRPIPKWPVEAATPHYPFLSTPPSKVVASPDPLRSTVFDTALANGPDAELVCYALAPVAVKTAAHGAFICETPYQSVEVKGRGDLRFDFGVLSAGWIEFESDDIPADAEFSISEYNQPAVVNEGAQYPKKTAHPIRVSGSTWRLVLNREYYEGVRFGWLHSRSGNSRWSLRNLRLVCQARPTNYAGSFECDDPLLERIWETGALTVRLSLLRDHFGSILVERGDRHSWTGDAYVSQAAAMPVFGNFGLVRANLDRTANDTNGIESYSLYWILSLVDYVLCSGETVALREHAAIVREKLRHAVEVVRNRTKLGFCGHDDRTGSAFKEPEIEANHRFYRLLALRTVHTVRTALAWIGGDEETAKVCNAVETALLETPLPALGILGLHDGTEAVLADALKGTPSEFLDREYRNPVTCVSYSPFNNYFVLQGMAHARCYAEAMGLVRRCWGGMIQLGATTFWEVFRPEWLEVMQPSDPPPDGVHGYTSLCHPWSAGVTRWLTDHVLGIRPTAPGYSEFIFDPIASGSKKVSGSVATARGGIRAGFDGREAWLVIPTGCRGSVKTNIGIRQFGPGRHEFEIAARDVDPVATSQQNQGFAAAWEADTSLSAGLTRSSGWIAFAATPEGGDISNLGSETSLTISENMPGGSLHRRHFGGNAEHDTSAMGKSRQITAADFRGALRTNVATVFEQTFTVDIKRPDDLPYSLGIFCQDVLDEGIVQTVDVLDLETKTLVAPTRIVQRFEGGLVLWLRFNRSVRLRICHCPGPDVTLGGLLFAS